MATQKVNIDINTKGARKSKDQLGGLNKSITSLGRSALNAGAAYFGARGLINAIKFSTESFGIQEQAEKSLEVALGRTSKALLDQASALQKVTTFGDESIIGVQASIGAFLDSEEQIKKATEATLDIAVAMGMDLKSAGDLVAKTLGSSTNAMSRYGITVEGAVGSNERLESMVKNVSELFGGQAKAQADTYAGSVQQLQNSLGDMAEDIGRIVVPVFENLEPHLRLAIDFWSEYLDVGDKSKGSQTLLGGQIDVVNRRIEQQRDLIDFISSESYLSFELRKKRLTAEGRTLTEQLIFEGEQYQNNVDILDQLIIKKEQLIGLDTLLSEKTTENLEIRKAEVKTTMDYVKVIDPATLANKRSAKSYLEMSDSTKKFAFALNSASQLNREASHRNALFAKRAAQLEAVVNTASAVVEVLPNIPLSIAMGTLGAIQIAKIESAKFADGGIVHGSGNTDSVPAMLTPGEVILNAAQQDNLTSNMGGVTLNIQGNVIGTEEFVRDTLIPEINNTIQNNLS